MLSPSHTHFGADAFREFPEGWSDGQTPMQRREFLRLMAASMAMAAAAGCSRTPPENIVPNAHNQEGFVPGVPQRFATCVLRSGYAMGVLVRSDDGRPTKIEGNPDHPGSLGATDAITQAELLTLYDPERSAAVRRGNTLADWDAFEGALHERLESLAARRGEGLHIVLPPLTSPTTLGVIDRIRERFPLAVWYRHDPLDTAACSAGVHLAVGRHLDQVIDLSRAKAIVGLDAEPFGPTPAGVRHAHDFALARREALSNGSSRPELLIAEPVPTTSGARADHRLAVRRSDTPVLAAAIAFELGFGPKGPDVPRESLAWVRRASAALKAAGAEGLVIAGPFQPAVVHALALSINARLGSIGRAVRHIDPVEPYRLGARPLAECTAALHSGVVDALLLIGVNPVFDAPHAGAFTDAIGRAKVSVHMGLYRDETALHCDWHLPMAHDLERWGDARAFDGTASIIQPLTQPIYGGRSSLWLLSRIAGERLAEDHGLVAAHWRAIAPATGWEEWWRATLKAGVVAGSAAPTVAIPTFVALSPEVIGDSSAIEIAINPDGRVLDGSYATNAWLQELPDPITQLTWGNAALLSPVLAAELAVQNGDVLRIGVGAIALDIPALVLPGMASRTIGMALGYGRAAGNAVALGRGVDVGILRVAGDPWNICGVSARRTGQTRELVLAQLHPGTDGRDIVRVLRPGETPPAQRAVHLPLYQSAKPTSAQQWGMSIDLASCTGCGACIVACQAENNVPVVGPEEVARGRRMHWLRVDRYIEPAGRDPEFLFQPLACVHCEEAPCEVVCPTGATQHSSDGLNEMNYARCVGTRYCSNNCPYKVRRFNFFRYADDHPQAQRMHNPRVTTRGRGVMEKCTYCVQRIRSAEFDARPAHVPIPDGAVVPACQQACPVQAIVFGDVADPSSRVSAAKRGPRSYSLLGELNTKPRTTYLADIRPARSEGEP